MAMARQFIAKSLASGAVDMAYALARSGAPRLSLEQWRGYANGLIRRGATPSGVLTVENLAGTILGLCSYRIDPAPGQGAICSVEFLVALDLVDNEAVTTALLKALEALARRQGAVALRLDLPYGTPATKQLLGRLDKSGHRIDKIRLLKQLSVAS
jgi:hypothetical protein